MVGWESLAAPNQTIADNLVQDTTANPAGQGQPTCLNKGDRMLERLKIQKKVFMAEDIGMIAKVVGISALLAIAIRYGAPFVTWPSGVPVVVALVVLPSIILGVLLVWRGQQAC